MNLTNIFFLFNIKHLYTFIFLLTFIVLAFCYKQHKKKQKSIILNSNVQPFWRVLKYLDNYYITNIYFTIFKIFGYLSGNLGVMIFLRYSYQKNTHILFPIDPDLNILNITPIQLGQVSVYFLFIILLIMMYKFILNSFFFDELNKLHIYLAKNYYYCYLQSLLNNTYMEDLFGKLYLFFFNISHLNTVSPSIIEEQNVEEYQNFIHLNFQNNNENSCVEYQEFNHYDSIYENKTTIYWAISFVQLYKQSVIF